MKFVADIHIHSRFSRATSRNLTLPKLHEWGLRKGVTVIGSGDFTHPAWRAELTDQLIPAEPGLYRLRPDLRKEAEQNLPQTCSAAGDSIRFILQVEISTIYKSGDRTRKVHHVILCPSLAEAEKFSAALAQIGNVTSDGRPILGLDSRDLLELVLEHCPGGILIPAHVWTPWFSVLGSKSGFDSIEECYRDLSEHIFAIETGLSSDPKMNWRVSSLDKYALVSNSDAHSPNKLARECNLFDTELSYQGMMDALRNRDPQRFLGTIEFFPEEGKYHLDGHRKCHQRLTPVETLDAKGRCPSCGRLITIGVMHRVEELADHREGRKPQKAAPFECLIGLDETVGHVLECGPATKKVKRVTERLTADLGSELDILRLADLERIETLAGDLIAEAIRRVRSGEVHWNAGYDGEYGVFEILSAAERRHSSGQMGFQDLEIIPSKQPDQHVRREEHQTKRTSIAKKPRQRIKTAPPTTEKHCNTPSSETSGDDRTSKEDLLQGLGQEQLAAVIASGDKPLLVIAGPGTGKTRTLTTRIAHRLATGKLEPQHTLALTFTNRAAEEMAERLGQITGEILNVMTFHSWGLSLLRATSFARPRIIQDNERLQLIAQAVLNAGVNGGRPVARRVAELISLWKSGREELPETAIDEKTFLEIFQKYQYLLEEEGAFDFDDLVLRSAELLEVDEPVKGLPQRPRAIFIDEYQDLNATQVRMLKAAVLPGPCELFAIGDPDQAIYGFRGADPRRILKFDEDWPGARVLTLGRSYRSSDTILKAASQVIASAPGLERPKLWSGIEGQPHLIVMSAQTDVTESERIALFIEQLLGGTGFLSLDSQLVDGMTGELNLDLGDIAVLYRLRNQGEPIARALAKLGLPVQMTSHNTVESDEVASAVIAAARLITGRASRDERHQAELEGWFNALKEIGPQLGSASAEEVVERITTAIFKDAQSQNNAIAALVKTARRTDESHRTKLRKEALDGSFVTTARPIDDFLDWLTLHSEADRGDPRASKISLMTLHASKGLEWKVVVIAGCEDGLLPHHRPKRPVDIDEERRLFFVGMTRAEQLLVLSHANERTMYGQRRTTNPSPFLEEIEKRYTKAATAVPPKKRRAAKKEQMELF